MTAPSASSTSRSRRSVAPTAASMPSWRSRRWAMTTNPAAAISETSSSRTVDAASVSAPAVAGSSPASRSRELNPPTACPKASSCASATTSSDSVVAWSISDGGTRANSSPRSAGSSTRPTTVRASSPSSTSSPTPTPSLAASSSVTATSPAVRG
jgi:hypothetical protein